ncbi:TetR/AcrR family transcriptional regulator [Microvirga guangxiensis]|uniref:Transcriptional regulator, TetR family n=1 Tax=Microvirga guangxiensis TaxID=549386 RepID=A0A1G5GX63_9HYPH|nr:TetR/AcrR family transcriptional regulator [Microvirga guangxiensis]SCY56136.1 transcriptional regulator, TetR family [Microvirga guangxiensis]
MLENARGRKSSREKILDAAAELVSEIGAGRLTLDAVAERAGLSKGGLLYNFPSKEALLQAMIRRMIDQVTESREALRPQLKPGPNLEARLATTTLLNMCCDGKMQEIATGLMVATAENPRLLDPVREVISETLQRIKSDSDDDAALLGWLAVEGLSNLEMHNLSPFSDQDRERIVQAINRLLTKGIAS